MFSSFFLAGFECTTGFNRHNQWIDQVAATRHDLQMDEDYALLRRVGIRAAREGVRWPVVDRISHYDFSTLDQILRVSRKYQIQIIYDLFHFGFPVGLDLFSAEFPARFADYCGAVARHIASATEGPYYFTPLNEPSYFSWAAGEVGLFAPHMRARGADLKIRLIMAMIGAARAIHDVCPTARLVNADPICRVVAPADRPDMEAAARDFNNEVVFESWDMLAGRKCSELGGGKDILDIVGINYYWTNQWVLGRNDQPLDEEDSRYCRLGDLIASVWERYHTDIVLTETSHMDSKRREWLDHITGEAERLLDRGIPLRGICLYPILGMPEWHDRSVWTQMGLWDLVQTNGHLGRICHKPMLQSLRRAQERLEMRPSK